MTTGFSRSFNREDGTRNGEILRTILTAGMELAEEKFLLISVSLGPELRNIPLWLRGSPLMKQNRCS